MYFKEYNIYDLNYEHCSQKLNLLELPKGNLPKKGILLRIIGLLISIIKKQRQNKSKKNVKVNTKANVFFVISKNEMDSIKPIASRMENYFLLGNDSYENGFPMKKIYWKSILFIPIVFLEYLKCTNKYHKESFKYAFDNFCLSYSAISILPKYLKKINPNQIIISNHTYFLHRILIQAAKTTKITTIYIQHSAVNEKFPSLNGISKALLEGNDSLIKYQMAGTEDVEIYIIGMPKFDKYYKDIKNNKILRNIAICTNGIDRIDFFENLIILLKKRYNNYNFFLRPHIADRRLDKWMQIANNNKIDFSSSEKENAFDFLKKIDLLIAGESSIHLEAVLCNVTSIFLDSNTKEIDWYGFYKNGLVYKTSNISDVIRLIDKFSFKLESVRHKAIFFIDTINTKFDGKSSEIAKKILEKSSDLDLFFTKIQDKNKNIINHLK